MKFIAMKTEGGRKKGKIAFYCRILKISRQGFNKFLKNQDKPWKYQPLANAMLEVIREEECNDTYGRSRMHQALKLKKPDGVEIPSERTVYRVMEKLGISHNRFPDPPESIIMFKTDFLPEFFIVTCLLYQ